MRLALHRALAVVWVSDDRADPDATERVALAALRGGVRACILREARLDDTRYVRLVTALLPAFEAHGAWLLGHERPWLVGRCPVHGWHRKAAALAGPSLRASAAHGVLGVSTHAAHELAAAARHGADYVLLGSVLATRSHPGQPFLGREVATQLAATAQVPVVAIGGIVVATAAGWMRSGFAGVASSSAIGAARDPEGAARELVAAVAAEVVS